MRDRVGLGRDAERCMNEPPRGTAGAHKEQLPRGVVSQKADPAVAPKRGTRVGDVLKKAIRKRKKPMDGHDDLPRVI